MNKIVQFEVREKNFEMTLQLKICSGKLLQEYIYQTNQTRWSCDVWNEFYNNKRELVKIINFQYYLQQKFLKRDFCLKLVEFFKKRNFSTFRSR